MSFDLVKFFDSTDRMDKDEFKSYFSQDATWTFGNNPPLVGTEALTAMASQFFSQLVSIKHELSLVLADQDHLMFDGYVSYHLIQSDKKITLPFACKMILSKNKIKHYMTYIDVSPLYT